MNNIFNLSEPLLDLSIWLKITLIILCGVIQSIGETLCFHREATHNAIKLNHYLKRVLELYLGFLTGIKEKLWVVLHRVHHKNSDGIDDIHSPQNPKYIRIFRKKIKFSGPFLCFLAYFYLYKKVSYFKKIVRKEKIDIQVQEAIESESWFSRTILHKYVWLGPIIFFVSSFVLFGWFGIIFFISQILWLPFFAGYVVNGLGHNKEEKNEKRPNDFSTNVKIFASKIISRPFEWILSILTGGESLHGGHHKHQTSAKLSEKRGEFDFGYFIIQVLQKIRLVEYVKYYNFNTNKFVEWKLV